MNRTNGVLLKRLEYINEIEYRPASYKDFGEFEVDGKLYKLKNSTLRNRFSVLKNEGRIERYFNSRASFFVIKGVKFGKQRTLHAMTEHNKTQLSEAIQQLHTDTVTVTVACSKNPVSTEIDDVNGVIRLAAALGRTQERIQRIVDECGQSLPGGYESIPIPDSGTWKVTMWHLAVDTLNYKEVKTSMTWKDAHGVLLREYNKKNEGKLRRERQEYPNKSFAESSNRPLSNPESVVFDTSPQMSEGLT